MAAMMTGQQQQHAQSPMIGVSAGAASSKLASTNGGGTRRIHVSVRPSASSMNPTAGVGTDTSGSAYSAGNSGSAWTGNSASGDDGLKLNRAGSSPDGHRRSGSLVLLPMSSLVHGSGGGGGGGGNGVYVVGSSDESSLARSSAVAPATPATAVSSLTCLPHALAQVRAALAQAQAHGQHHAGAASSSPPIGGNTEFVLPPNLLERWGSISNNIRRASARSKARGRKLVLALFFGYDGILSPIVANPAAATLSPAMSEALANAARIFPLAVISGRPLSSLHSLLAGVVAPAAVVGNTNDADAPVQRQPSPPPPVHVAASFGHEILLSPLQADLASASVHQFGASALPVLSRFYAVLCAALERHPLLAAHLAARDISVEHNGFSLTVHYRGLMDAISGVQQLRSSGSGELNHAADGGDSRVALMVGALTALDCLLSDLLAADESFQSSLMRTHGKMVFEIKLRVSDEEIMEGPAQQQQQLQRVSSPQVQSSFVAQSAALNEAAGFGVASPASGSVHKGHAVEFLLRHVLYPGQNVQLQLDQHGALAQWFLEAPTSNGGGGIDVLPVYCGDNLSDEDAFALLQPLQYGTEASEQAGDGRSQPATTPSGAAGAAAAVASDGLPSAPAALPGSPSWLPALSVFVSPEHANSSNSSDEIDESRPPTMAHFSLRGPGQVLAFLQALIALDKSMRA
jgi:trehalose-6-phosphatase